MNALLFVVGLFRPLYTAMDVDFNQLTAIVRTKITMDNRGNISAFQKQNTEPSSRFFWVVLLHLAFGLLIAGLMLMVPSFLISLTLYHSFIMLMISMTLIQDFSSVLLDTSDNTILLPRPVSDRTLVAARLTHILLYIGQLSVAIVVLPLVLVGIQFGMVMVLLTAVTSVLAVLFAVTVTYGLYLLIMQLTSEERLKSILNYFQVAVTILFMGGYQIFPRLVFTNLTEANDFQLQWWSCLLPPFWMSGALDSFYAHNTDTIHIVLIILATVLPIGGSYFINRYLTAGFTDKLTDLGIPIAVPSGKLEKGTKGPFAPWIARAGLERASYSLVNAVLAHDRKLKLKIYPAIGFVFVFGFVILINGKHSLKLMFNRLPVTSSYIFLLYITCFTVITVLAEIDYSDEFKAAWIYMSTPLQRPGEILSGVWKAVMVKFFLPLFIVFGLFVLFVWGFAAVDDICFALGGNIFLFLAIVNFSKKRFPFSLEPSPRNQTENFVRTIIAMVLLAAMGGLHFILSKVPYTLWIGSPLLLLGAYALLKGLRATPWSEIET